MDADAGDFLREVGACVHRAGDRGVVHVVGGGVVNSRAKRFGRARFVGPVVDLEFRGRAVFEVCRDGGGAETVALREERLVAKEDAVDQGRLADLIFADDGDAVLGVLQTGDLLVKIGGER